MWSGRDTGGRVRWLLFTEFGNAILARFAAVVNDGLVSLASGKSSRLDGFVVIVCVFDRRWLFGLTPFLKNVII